MILTVHYSNQFKKDLRRNFKQGKDLQQINEVIDLLINEIPLKPVFKDHPLKGKYSQHRECHIAPDWLLIYQIINGSELVMVRTGSHSELFK